MFWKISCGVLGAGLLLAAGLSSPGGLEAALGRPAGILTWGPSLFRALLAFHGLAALYVAFSTWTTASESSVSCELSGRSFPPASLSSLADRVLFPSRASCRAPGYASPRTSPSSTTS